MYQVINQVRRRTIVTRMSGHFTEKEMRAWAAAYKQATDTYGGKPHLVLADMRGLLTCAPAIAEIVMEAIGYARRRGVALCAHVSDQTVTRLQTARVARQASEGDDVTIDCVSVEEAEEVLREKRVDLLAAAR
ncbi:MAG TPA: hypothetical protein VHB21_20645 [Minicystis sp.]|nr:hypothetical protein [Minicystis sp.]